MTADDLDVLASRILMTAAEQARTEGISDMQLVAYALEPRTGISPEALLEAARRLVAYYVTVGTP